MNVNIAFPINYIIIIETSDCIIFYDKVYLFFNLFIYSATNP